MLLLFDRHQLSENVLEELLVIDRALAIMDYLIKHILESHHIVRAFLKWEVHDPQHNDDEMLYFGFLIRQLFKFLFDDLQLSIEDQSTDLRGRVFRQVLNIPLLQEFLNKTYYDLYSFLTLYQLPEGKPLVLSF